MLHHEDEILKAQLNLSRRGATGHCSRDTADLWIYIVQIFFKVEDGYVISVENYQEQDDASLSDSEMKDFIKDMSSEVTEEDAEIPGGEPVWIQVWKLEGMYFDPENRRWAPAAQIPVLTILCSSVEKIQVEYPPVRHGITNSHTLYATTPLQHDLYNRCSPLLQRHNGLVEEGRCPSSVGKIKSLSGAIACGSMVRFFKLKVEEAERNSRVFSMWSPRGLDLVNGDPSQALTTTEKILLRIAGLNRKGKK